MWKLLIGNGRLSKVKKRCQEPFEFFSISCAFAGSRSIQSVSSGDAKQQIKLTSKRRLSAVPPQQSFIPGVKKRKTTEAGWFNLNYSSRQHLFNFFVFFHSFDKFIFTCLLFK